MTWTDYSPALNIFLPVSCLLNPCTVTHLLLLNTHKDSSFTFSPHSVLFNWLLVYCMHLLQLSSSSVNCVLATVWDDGTAYSIMWAQAQLQRSYCFSANIVSLVQRSLKLRSITVSLLMWPHSIGEAFVAGAGYLQLNKLTLLFFHSFSLSSFFLCSCLALCVSIFCFPISQQRVSSPSKRRLSCPQGV